MRYFSISLLLMAFLCVLPACSDMGSDGDKNKADMAKTGQNASDLSYFDDQMQKQNETKRKDMTIPEDAPLVVMFGDSLYAGYQLDNDAGLVPQLQAALYDKDMPVKMHNAAVSGDTTNGGLQRIKFVLDGLDRKPDLFVLGLGGNDMLRAVPAAQTRKNLDEMMQILQERGIKVLITGMVAPANMGQEYEYEFDSIYPDLAEKYDAVLYHFILDHVVTNPDYMLGDGIHPNAKGVHLMAENLAPYVKRALQSEMEE